MYKVNFTYVRNVLNGVCQFGNGNSSEKEEESVNECHWLYLRANSEKLNIKMIMKMLLGMIFLRRAGNRATWQGYHWQWEFIVI